jgi:sorbose reductase
MNPGSIMNVSSQLKLIDKKVLITGAGQGLGRAFARAFAEAGADVAIVDIDGNKAKEVSEEIINLGRRSLAVKADVSVYSDIYGMVEEVMSNWGRLDIAINNAGTAQFKVALEINEEDWDKIIDLNLRGAFFCCQAEAKAMLPNKYGKIINIASICGHIVWPPAQAQASYNTSKAGLIHLTKNLAAEWIKYGIRVNSISPGVTLTPGLTQKVISVFVNKAPIGKTADIKDIQGAVLFLASEESDFIIGNDIVIDGGYTLL